MVKKEEIRLCKVEGFVINVIMTHLVDDYVAILDAFSKCFPAFSYEITDNMEVSEAELPVAIFTKNGYRKLYVVVEIADLSPYVVQQTEQAYHTMCLSNHLVPSLKHGFYPPRKEHQSDQG